ncbi:MAG: endonuclease/exonuclease/phosphatase family protein [Vicinamibacterales bacterium]
MKIVRFSKALVLTAAVAVMQLLAVNPALAASSVYLDTPRANQVVGESFHIGGWAVDWAARATTGVMTIHVWAYPSNGAPPIFLGVPSAGSRGDVAAVFGANFLNCGFGLNIKGTLAPGNYLLAVFPYSDIRRAFDYDSAIGIPITVQATAAPAPTTTTPTTTTPTTTTPTTTTSGGVKLRVLEWNIHHGVGTDGVYNIDRLATWMAKMNPDVVLLNEVEKHVSWWGNEDQPARFKSMLEAKTGRRWYAHFSQEFGQWSSPGKGHLMLSTYPFESTNHVNITASSGLKGAGAASQAAVMVNNRNINFIVSHLDPYDQDMRLRQARDVINWAAGYAENRILSGDMNAWPDQSSIAEFNKTYTDTWTAAVNLGTATGVSGITPFGATKKGRIDYIFLSKGASGMAVLESKVYDTRDGSGIMPSDHRPVLTTFEVR